MPSSRCSSTTLSRQVDHVDPSAEALHARTSPPTCKTHSVASAHHLGIFILYCFWSAVWELPTRPLAQINLFEWLVEGTKVAEFQARKLHLVLAQP
eukprot:1844940-Amphidinium_carterae.1